jgi:hypothetical membrane protein
MKLPAETSRIKLRWGAGLWIVAVVQYLVAQIVVAHAWTTPYSWTGNFISDLGNTGCGQFAVPHGQSSYVCSPQHWVMNASFIVSGLVGGVGVLLLRRFWPARRMVTVGVGLWLAAAAGKIIVGIVPENANIGLHTLGALNIPLGSIAILLLGRSALHNGGWLRTTGIVLSCLGLVGTVVSVAGQYSGSAAYLGLGAGGAERLASYPGSLWMLIISAVVVMTPSAALAPRTSSDPATVTVDAPA